MAGPTGSSSFANQAALAVLLKYKPQKEGLAEIQRAAEEQAASSIQAGKTESILGQAAATAAKPQVQQIYNSAEKQDQGARNLTQPTLAALSATSPFRVSTENERAGGSERLANERAREESDLHQKGVAATELPAFTRESAMTKLANELTKLHAKGKTIASDEGAEAANQLDKLNTEAKKNALTKEGHQITRQDSQEGHNVTKEDSERTHSPKSATEKPLGHKEQNAGISTIEQIKHYAGELGAGSGTPRSELVAQLTSGAPEASHKREVLGPNGKPIIESNGKPRMESIPIPKVPAFQPNVLMSAALDWAEYGHLQKPTETRLEKAGYDVEALGIPKAGRGASAVPQKASDIGKTLQAALGW